MPEAKVLVIGLDNAGKTTLTARLLQRFQHPVQNQLSPTIGLETHLVKKGSNVYKIFDLGGSGHFRSLWELYAGDATHIIVVVDATDKSRLFVIRDEVQQLVGKIRRAGQKVLLCANKADVATAASHDKIITACTFESVLKDFNLKGCSCSALRDTNMDEVFGFVALTTADLNTKEKEKK